MLVFDDPFVFAHFAKTRSKISARSILEYFWIFQQIAEDRGKSGTTMAASLKSPH